ncbi:YfhH family protein [Alkalihalobacillus pseudalcaliphilus]|uniref:YfhH family protein n=1 Tax=Alkalihalobacillus pseudalcaliphilus TaxID=79884 RepID=UPI00064DE492|nr:YfhH family protein [Alkalihalobacillus pseudalcaliphilus]KMK74947.1 hypothetical protein AB990_15830 [Alkalihalobacillus pseudalcaliphilus]
MEEKRFSEMGETELHTVIRTFNEKAKKAEQLGMMNEYAVYERKVWMAKAYLLDPKDFEPGKSYPMFDGESTFQISYLNGHFAWGYRNQEANLDAVPISLLKK